MIDTAIDELTPIIGDHLVAVAAELNGRPRKTLNLAKPAEAMQQLLSNPSRVARTPEIAKLHRHTQVCLRARFETAREDFPHGGREE